MHSAYQESAYFFSELRLSAECPNQAQRKSEEEQMTALRHLVESIRVLSGIGRSGLEALADAGIVIKQGVPQNIPYAENYISHAETLRGYFSKGGCVPIEAIRLIEDELNMFSRFLASYAEICRFAEMMMRAVAPAEHRGELRALSAVLGGREITLE